MRRIWLIAGAFAALAATPAPAADPPAVEGLKFLSAAELRPSDILAPPPAPASVQAAYELAELQRLERDRSSADLARARHDDETEDASIFAEAIGSGFDLKSCPPPLG